jgi:hypothetical protein
MSDQSPLKPQGGRGQETAPSATGLLWAALALLAALLRLTDLAAAPLTSAEAAQALAAYHVGQTPLPGAAVGAPLLFHLNVLLFALFGDGDGLARMVPALAGVGLVLAPLLLTRYLGRWGALGMGLLLALSPTALFFSRTLDGTVPAALGMLLLVGCAARFLDTWHPALVIAGGLGLALALTAGPAAWGMGIGLLLALVICLWAWRGSLPWLWPLLRPALGRGLLATMGGLLAFGAGMGLNPAGLAAVGQQLLGWLARFAAPAGPAAPSFALLLGVYEPLLLLVGLAGLVLAVQRRHGLGLLFACWAALSLLQLTLMPGRQPADLLWLLLPLSGLGGLAVESLVTAVARHGRWLNEGLYLPISLVLWAHCGLALARYSVTNQPTDLYIAGLAAILQVLLTIAFGFAVSVPEPDEETAQVVRQGLTTALRAGALSVTVLLLLVTLSTGWGLAHVRPADPREGPVQRPTAVEVRLLVETVEQVATLTHNGTTGLPVTIVGSDDPALIWALRHFDLRFADAPPGRAASPGLLQQDVAPGDPPLVVVPAQTARAEGYIGAAFTLHRTWSPQWGGAQTVRWWLYRESASPLTSEQVALWVREDLRTAR